MTKQRFEKKKVLLTTIVTLSLFGALGFALWLSGIGISGNVSVSSGSQQEQIIYAQDLNITEAGNTSYNFTYDNQDGQFQLTFSLNDTGIVSDSANCNFESGKDLLFFVGVDGNNFEPILSSPTKTIPPGESSIDILIVSHENRCELSGSYEILGII